MPSQAAVSPCSLSCSKIQSAIFQMPRPLLPTPAGAMPGFIPGAPALFTPGMPFIHPAPPVEPPSAKKPRSEMDNFVSERDFIAANPVSSNH